MSTFSRKMHFRLHRDPVWGDHFAMRVWQDTFTDGIRSVAIPTGGVTFRVLTPEEDGCITEPLMNISGESAQQLMDELWRAGLRPTEGTGSAGSLAATERHLADMRALVFKQEVPPLIFKK